MGKRTKKQKDSKQESKCPKCSSNTLVPALYGKPLSRAIEKAERGEIILAGCKMPGDKIPQMKCKNCSYTKYRKKSISKK